jgi:hypothetical protein
MEVVAVLAAEVTRPKEAETQLIMAVSIGAEPLILKMAAGIIDIFFVYGSHCPLNPMYI